MVVSGRYQTLQWYTSWYAIGCSQTLCILYASQLGRCNIINPYRVVCISSLSTCIVLAVSKYNIVGACICRNKNTVGSKYVNVQSMRLLLASLHHIVSFSAQILMDMIPPHCPLTSPVSVFRICCVVVRAVCRVCLPVSD